MTVGGALTRPLAHSNKSYVYVYIFPSDRLYVLIVPWQSLASRRPERRRTPRDSGLRGTGLDGGQRPVTARVSQLADGALGLVRRPAPRAGRAPALRPEFPVQDIVRR